MFKDEAATAAANFLNPDSYVKRAKDGELQYYRFGDDMRVLRVAAFERSGGYCEMPVRGYANGVRCNRNISWETMELDHNPSLAQGGDDSLEGVRAICRRCHVVRHNRVTKFRAGAAHV
jgi:5-methylcytosine-specific restriction endonuclease McrA